MSIAKKTRHWNIPWLSDLPTHWDVVPSKRLFSARKELTRPDDEQLAATQAYGVIPQKEYERRIGRRVVQITQNLEKRRHVEKDDFIISMRSFEGGLERAWASGCIRSSYVVLKPSAEVDPGYFKHLFKSHDYIQALRATSNFIRDGQDLNMSNFSLVDLPLPPIVEQTIISRYLDHVDVHVRRLIRAKKALIGLLNEQKQAIIHRAVTCGLDANAKLKPSGIPWLGDVPDEWEVSKLKRLGRLRSGEGITAFQIEESGSFPVYGGNGHRGYAARHTHDGDFILIGRQGALCGNIHLATGKFFASEHAIVVHPRKKYDVRWLAEVLRVMNLNQYSIAAAQPGLSVERIEVLGLPVPSCEVQTAIMRSIDDETTELNGAINLANREIALIQEFRTRMIADVVTGKLDVRALATSLPETAVQEATPDQSDDEDLDDLSDDLEPEEAAA